MAKLLIFGLLLAALCAAQEIPLGDVARQDRARQEAIEAANFRLGVPPPVAHEGELVPADFLVIQGHPGQGEFLVKLNNKVICHNSYLPIPQYISRVLLDGGNLLEVSMVSGNEPFDITIEERRLGETTHTILAHFHADATVTPTAVTKQVRFTAHPLAPIPVELSDRDRDDITKLVKDFYAALKRKDGKQAMAMFAPAIEDARGLYPEGADYGEKEMSQMADLLAVPGFSMESFDAIDLVMETRGSIVIVKRRDGLPVFTSNEIVLPDGRHNRLSADTIPVKKVQGVWRLTLPFGF